MIDTEALKRKILDLAIKGKLVPQDPTDEPASELLKRIKNERDRLIDEGKIKGKKDDFSYIFKGDDNCYYEKNTRDVKQFKGVLPYELPNGWCFIKIKNIASLYTGDSINQDVKKAKYTNIEKGFNYIGTKDIGYDNQINYENGVKIPFNDPFKVCPKGKILLCIEGGNAGNKIAISEENVCFGNKLLCFNTFLFEDTFLFIYLQSTIFRNVFKSKETGLIGGVSIPKIGDCYIPIPSRNEQLKIVKIVKDFLNKINSINRLFVDIENLKLKIKSRIISLGVQGKLLNTDDNYYYQNLHHTFEPLYTQIKVLDQYRRPVNSNERKERIAKASIKYPYYGATGQAGEIDEYLLDGQYVLIGEDCAPFLDKYQDKAYIVNGKFWVNNHAHILSSKCNEFLCFYLNTFDYHQYVSGTTRLKLTQKDLKRIPYPVLSEHFQKQIAQSIIKAIQPLESIA